MAILAPHVSTSILHFSIRLSARSDGFFWILPGTEIGRWSFFAAHRGGITSDGNVITAAEITDKHVRVDV